MSGMFGLLLPKVKTELELDYLNLTEFFREKFSAEFSVFTIFFSRWVEIRKGLQINGINLGSGLIDSGISFPNVHLSISGNL